MSFSFLNDILFESLMKKCNVMAVRLCLPMWNMEEKGYKLRSLNYQSDWTNYYIYFLFFFTNLPKSQDICVFNSCCRDNSNYKVVYKMHEKNVIITWGKLQSILITSDSEQKKHDIFVQYYVELLRDMAKQTW